MQKDEKTKTEYAHYCLEPLNIKLRWSRSGLQNLRFWIHCSVIIQTGACQILVATDNVYRNIDYAENRVESDE